MSIFKDQSNAQVNNDYFPKFDVVVKNLSYYQLVVPAALGGGTPANSDYSCLKTFRSEVFWKRALGALFRRKKQHFEH